MKACLLHSPARVETNPLEFTDVPDPIAQGDQVLVRVAACGVCRTDLHVVEGELPPRKSPVIPGHQVVGRVVQVGSETSRFRPGDRVGIPWLHRTCGVCEYCRAGKENLCDNPTFTGYVVDGGYAEYTLAPEEFRLPHSRGPLRMSMQRRYSAPASSASARCVSPASSRAASWDCTGSGRPPT